MSDINLDFSGLLALFTLLVTIGMFAAMSVFFVVASFYQMRVSNSRLVEQKFFNYFVAAAIILIFNALVFVLLVIIIDHISKDAKEGIDSTLLFGWLPLNFILFFVVKIPIRRRFNK